MIRRRTSARALLLMVLATCTGPQQPSAPSRPPTTGAPGPGAVVRRVDLRVRYVLDGVSRESAEVQVLPNPAFAFVPAVRPGARVSAGDELGRTRISLEIRRALVAGAATSSIDAAELAQLRSLRGRLPAPVDGVFMLWDGVPAIRAPGIDAVASLLPIQYLRLRSIPFSGRASIETIIGQRSVPCTAVWVQIASGDPPYELHCRLPGYVETAAGLRARITLTSKVYRDVVVVPNIYVGYDRKADGYYVTILENGRQRRVPIMVGITDGVVRVVTSDLPVGAPLVPPSDG